MSRTPLGVLSLSLGLAGVPLLSGLAQPAAIKPAAPAQPLVPAESAIGRLSGGEQRLLLSTLDGDAAIEKAGWRMRELAVEAASMAVTPKVGQSALRFRGSAEIAGAKGDFTLAGAVPGRAKHLGIWVYLAGDANVERVGFQVHDVEGEVLLALVPADWQGWRWVEVDLQSGSLSPAYEQPGKSRKVETPLSGIHFAWFAKSAGPSSLSVDGLVAVTGLSGPPGGVEVRLTGPTQGEPNTPLGVQELVATNFTGEARTLQVEVLVQQDPALYSLSAPDPVHGSDHARGAKSWTEVDGKEWEQGSLTDGRDWTNAPLPWGKYREAVQGVDLGRERTLTHLAYQAADANWAATLEISASPDGKSYRVVPGLEALDLRGKWGRQEVRVPQPFAARYLRLRHHQDGKEVNQLSLPSALSVYDGTADETWSLPTVGPAIARRQLTLPVPARSFATLRLPGTEPLKPGAYLLSARVKDGARTLLTHRHFMVLPPALKSVEGSRFGLNASNVDLAALHRRLGIGWVRFENLKWPMVSPRPGEYTFHGVAPWHVLHDRIMSGYREQGLQVLPFLFLTPDYATSAPASVQKNRNSYPPRDNAQLAEFVFQTVARYGARKHPEAALKTADKLSGLNRIHTWEIWNEPNLTDPNWGPWVGTTAQYNAMFRAAAEAVKRADPGARVTNGGIAGIDVETVNTLLTPYTDGKKPLDFVDILNVHFYSGRVAPELSTNDPNADRTGSTSPGARTYEDDLRRLAAWRDRHKPGLPIWLTETGYDSAGSFGTDEQTQAARLPRVIMLALAAGIDKVLVYREAGSTPSMHAASGLLRNDDTLKPAWFTYATLIRELNGVTSGTRLPYPDPNVRLYAWNRGAERLLSAWTVEGAGELKLRLGECTATDAFGHARRVKVDGRLPLSPFPLYLKSIGQPKELDALLGEAKRLETARRQERARLAKLCAYLFDFGSRERVGTLDLGDTRTFTAVLGADRYEEPKGYGFTPGAGGEDVDAHWIKDPLERDGTRMNPEHTFRLRPRPGRYELRVRMTPRGPGKLLLRGAAGGERTFPLAPNGPVITAEIEVGAEPLELSNTAYSDIRWLTLVERP